MSATKGTKKKAAAKAKAPAKGKKEEEAPVSARPKRVSKKRVADVDLEEDETPPQIRGAGELGAVARRLAAEHGEGHDEAEPNEEEFASARKRIDDHEASRKKKKAEEPKKKTPAKAKRAEKKKQPAKKKADEEEKDEEAEEHDDAESKPKGKKTKKRAAEADPADLAGQVRKNRAGELNAVADRVEQQAIVKKAARKGAWARRTPRNN
jgi:hypothetical protein